MAAAEEMSHRFYFEETVVCIYICVCVCAYANMVIDFCRFFSLRRSATDASRVLVAFLAFEVPSLAETLNSTPAARQSQQPYVSLNKNHLPEKERMFFGPLFEHLLLKPEKEGENIPQPRMFLGWNERSHDLLQLSKTGPPG